MKSMVIPEIASPSNLKIFYRNGKVEELYTRDCPNNMIYEAEMFVKAILGQEDMTYYQEKALESLKRMDEIRRQDGIVFPADRKEL